MFERLSPALQYQIVNSLGWSGLRPVQELATAAILDSANCVVLAPTAGGKTEAAFFPLLSKMDSEGWGAPSVLYIAPIRALLNNQDARLERLTGLIGRRTFKWHGDVGDSARTRFKKDPADVLSITPESLEAMLMSRRVPSERLLAGIRAVVVDEVHAFAATDRGAHLMALLERLVGISEYDLQRIGLSATVGDPEVICRWLSGSSLRPQRVVDPGGLKAQPGLALDAVGSLANAALMMDRLQPGTKRLVFADSRRRVEELGALLAARKANVFVTHSSLAASERHAAERAFEEGQNCVIVSTSALELGIDVGDLDHVLQLDAPSTVSAFLQRMGRTGRRPGTQPNCTFLCVSDEAVLQAAGLLRLRQRGFVENTDPSPRAMHVAAHQLLALSLQEAGVAEGNWWEQVRQAGCFQEMSEGDATLLAETMVSRKILFRSAGRLVLGPEGERLYAARHFQELYAVFSVPPVLTVMHGHTEVGSIDAWFLQQSDEWPMCFVLGGTTWQTVAVDWKGGTVTVKAAEAGTYPRWNGQPRLLSYELCQAMLEVLTTETEDPWWSARTRAVMTRLRESNLFLHDGPCPVVDDGDKLRWWTYGGGKANATLAALLRPVLGEGVRANNLALTFSGSGLSEVAVREAIDALVVQPLTWAQVFPLAPTSGKRRLSKFQPCLPERMELELVARATMDVEAAGRVLGWGPIRNSV